MLQTDFLIASKLDLVETEMSVGLVFKYSESINATGAELREICEKIFPYTHVHKTSGTKTGTYHTPGKIKETRAYLLDNSRLGVTGGVDAENVKLLKD